MTCKSFSTRLVFFTSAVVSITCFIVFLSGVCRGPLLDNKNLRFVSEYISECLQLSVYNSVPWILAVAVMASVLSVLLNWQSYHPDLHYQALAIHALVFHFCFNLACIVEFRTDGTAVSREIISVKIDEASLHKFSAVQAIVDFACIHLIVSSDSCEESDHDKQRVLQHELCRYRVFESVYVCCTYIFLLCWVVHAMLPAAIFEWFLVLCASAMQWFAIKRGALTCNSTSATNMFMLFAEKHPVVYLQGYVLVNLISVIAMTPPSLVFGVDTTVVPTLEKQTVHTGPEFWFIVLCAAVSVSMSMSRVTHFALLCGVSCILVCVLIYVLSIYVWPTS